MEGAGLRSPRGREKVLDAEGRDDLDGQPRAPRAYRQQSRAEQSYGTNGSQMRSTSALPDEVVASGDEKSHRVGLASTRATAAGRVTHPI